MNIFLFDNDVGINASYHCDKHVVKMITEYNQLLSTACHLMLNDNQIDFSKIYKKTHVNHPSNLWVRESKSHFCYLLKLNESLCKEYTLRYNKIHKGESLLPIFKSVERLFKDNGFKDIPKCMPDEYKVDSVVESYINYFNGSKQHIAKWKTGNIPPWFIAAS